MGLRKSRGQPSDRRVPIARATCVKERSGDVSGNRTSADVRTRRRPVQRDASPSGNRRRGGSMCECTVSSCGFFGRETGRWSKAGNTGPRAVEVDATDRATETAQRLRSSGVHEGGPRSRLGNWAAARAPWIGKPKRGDVHRGGNFAMNGEADRLRARATGLERRAHDKLAIRATGKRECGHGKLFGGRNLPKRAYCDELDARATVGRESGRDEPDSRGTVGKGSA